MTKTPPLRRQPGRAATLRRRRVRRPRVPRPAAAHVHVPGRPARPANRGLPEPARPRLRPRNRRGSVMSELDYITVKGFKSIDSIEKLELGPLTVLIGPNGSGKSNFVESVLLPERYPRGPSAGVRNENWRRRQSAPLRHRDVTKQLQIHISFQEEVNQYRIELEPNALTSSGPHGLKTSISGTRREGFPRRLIQSVESQGREAGISRQSSGLGIVDTT